MNRVELSPFFLSKYEMTTGQWARTAGGRGHAPLLHPVSLVSWNQCKRMLPRVGLTLPSEAQWEYAARAGTSTPWWTGDKEESLAEPAAGNLADCRAEEASLASFVWGVSWLDDGAEYTAPIGSYLPNPFGFYDTIGNVWEWCEDGLNIYPGAQLSRPRSDPVLRDNSYKILRGGSFHFPPNAARSAHRYHDSYTQEREGIGVRPARAIDP